MSTAQAVFYWVCVAASFVGCVNAEANNDEGIALTLGAVFLFGLIAGLV